MGGKGSGGGNRNPKGGPNMQVAVLDKEVASRTNTMANALMNLDTFDLNDLDVLGERITWYFNTCAEIRLKPTASGLGLALGMNRNSLHKIVTGEIHRLDTNKPQFTNAREREVSRESAALIKKAYEMLEFLWESNFQEGSIQPVVGIFLGKNNYGYRDQVENVVIPQNPLGESSDPKAIVEKYKSLPEPELEKDDRLLSD